MLGGGLSLQNLVPMLDTVEEIYQRHDTLSRAATDFILFF